MKVLTIALVAFLIITGSVTKAQNNKTPWIVGVGFNVVDDNGLRLGRPFDFKNSWNIVPYPSRLSIEKVLQVGFSLEAAGTYNQLGKEKLINGETSTKNTNYFAFDVSLKYDLSYFFDNRRLWLKPFILAGYGYSDRGVAAWNSNLHRNTTGGISNNLGIGFNYWFHKDFGVSAQAMGKFANKASSNHMQYSITFVYKFITKKTFTKRKDRSNHASEHIRRILSK